MSTALITHSSDLSHLEADGYDIQVVAGWLVVYNVPYLDSTGSPLLGTLFSAIDSDGSSTAYNSGSDHTVLFAGNYPHDASGQPLTGIQNASSRTEVMPGVWADHRFSARPQNNYRDYHHKMTTYIKRLGQPVTQKGYALDARPYRRVRSLRSPHRYADTNSARANITAINDKLAGLKVAIIGVGGTGSYILDLLTKTSVSHIYIYDGDGLLLHNAFRAPSAITKDRLRKKPNKALHYGAIYSRMHKRILAHPYHMTASRLHELNGMDFVFVCMDGGLPASELRAYLAQQATPYIDVGMGLRVVDGTLHGQIRTSLYCPGDADHPDAAVADEPDGDIYRSNIQVAELNALNACLAIIAWKQYYGLYPTPPSGMNSIFNLRTGGLIRHETAA